MLTYRQRKEAQEGQITWLRAHRCGGYSQPPRGHISSTLREEALNPPRGVQAQGSVAQLPADFTGCSCLSMPCRSMT